MIKELTEFAAQFRLFVIEILIAAIIKIAPTKHKDGATIVKHLDNYYKEVLGG